MTAEHPREYDIRKTAELDFTTFCEVSGCPREASHGVQCTNCGDVRSLWCAVHGDGLRFAHGIAQCGNCNAVGAHHAALYTLLPIGGA